MFDTLKLQVFTKNGCPSCDSIKDFLSSRDIDFDTVDLSDDRKRQEFYDRNGFVGNERRVPKVFEVENGIPPSLIGGCEETMTYITALQET